MTPESSVLGSTSFSFVVGIPSLRVELIRETVKSGGSVFSGPNSVVRKLAGEE